METPPIVLMKDRRREMIPVDKIIVPQLAHAGMKGSLK